MDKTLTRPCDMFGTGVTVDDATRTNATIMALTTLLYFVVHVSLQVFFQLQNIDIVLDTYVENCCTLVEFHIFSL